MVYKVFVLKKKERSKLGKDLIKELKSQKKKFKIIDITSKKGFSEANKRKVIKFPVVLKTKNSKTVDRLFTVRDLKKLPLTKKQMKRKIKFGG